MKTNDYKQERAIQLLFTKKNPEKYLSRRNRPTCLRTFSSFLIAVRYADKRLGKKIQRPDRAARIRFCAAQTAARA
jgi:hypothetical protein